MIKIKNSHKILGLVDQEETYIFGNLLTYLFSINITANLLNEAQPTKQEYIVRLSLKIKGRHIN